MREEAGQDVSSDGASPWDGYDSDFPPYDGGADASSGRDESGDDGAPDVPDAGTGPEPLDLDAATDVDPGQAPDAGPDASTGAPDAGSTTASVVFVGANATSQNGGTGGSPFAENCPVGHALIGYQGYLSTQDPYNWIVRLQGVCGQVTVEDGAASRATVSDPILLSERGIDGDVTWSRRCPANQVLVGYGGRAGNFLDQLVFYCAPVLVDGAGAGRTLRVGTAQALPAVGGSGGTEFSRADCPAGQAAYGNQGRSGQWVDALAFVCGTPTLD